VVDAQRLAQRAFGEIQPDWDRMGPYVERAMAR
jgi:hypothetical protein